jgi:glycine/D-amino acid oxidase-like deaminating enzyme
MANSRVAVIGGGIIGASIAYHLAKAGAAVTLLDQGGPVAGATASSFAWLNGSSGQTEAYVRLRQDSVQPWRDLDQTLGDALGIEWSGCVLWRPTPEETEQFVAERQAWGYPLSLIGRERILEIEPNLVDPPRYAAHMPAEGTLLPVEATLTLLAAAREAGVTVQHYAPVTGIDVSSGRIAAVETQDERLEVDHVVIAAGTETQAVAALAGASVPVTSTPGAAFYCKPSPRIMNGVLITEGFEMKQDASGRFISVANFAEDEPAPASAVERVVRNYLASVSQHVRGVEALEVEYISLGYRPLPPDGYPMVGPMPGVEGLYVAITHSGVSLAPIIGRYAAEEIMHGRLATALSPYSPDRFS